MVTFENVPSKFENALSTFKPHLESIVSQEIGNVNINFVFLDATTMTELNEEYRKKEGPTDVLTFVYGGSNEDFEEVSDEISKLSEEYTSEPYAEGYLCIDVIEDNAKDFKNSVEKELLTVLVHSILHMAGYDHEYKDDNAEEMFKKQDDYVGSIWPLVKSNSNT